MLSLAMNQNSLCVSFVQQCLLHADASLRSTPVRQSVIQSVSPTQPIRAQRCIRISSILLSCSFWFPNRKSGAPKPIFFFYIQLHKVNKSQQSFPGTQASLLLHLMLLFLFFYHIFSLSRDRGAGLLWCKTELSRLVPHHQEIQSPKNGEWAPTGFANPFKL